MGNNPSKSHPADGPSPVNSGAASLAASTSDKKTPRGTAANAPPSASEAPIFDSSALRDTGQGQSSSQNQTPIKPGAQSRNTVDSPARPVDRPDHTESKTTDVARPRDTRPPDQSEPVQVPVSQAAAARREPYEADASSAPHKMYYSAPHHLQRPPRLPLPIGDATAIPGSPISGPDDASPLAPERMPGDRTGTVSVDLTTIEDDDTVGELQPHAGGGVGRAVPTTIEWRGGGNKVFVTGTFVNWEKKLRLHKSETTPGVMSTKVNLRPGTHHLKFIVDGEMRASDNLPTAVDFTNHLVNYIELSADDVNRSRRESDKGTAPPGVHPQVLPDSAADKKLEPAVDEVRSDKEESEEPEEIPIGDFRNIIPPFLLDLDKDEDTPCYQQAVNIIGDAPTPPSLPLFLGKSILNGITPTKDDSSLLNNPNHTVLNHLATSSIKNGVLATSVTTRYKRKVTTFCSSCQSTDFID
ncbi:hypothetical protein BJX61DRAFT_519448 [Aspergillus egyptiacus]|nr:hypothetical protein BJX61DRAFT_519448 [Aspergillus egyptiacus]